MTNGIKKIGVVGLGLIGGSIALSLKSDFELIGVDSNPDTLDFCLKNGIIHAAASIDGLKGCDLIFVCVPVHYTAKVIGDVYSIVGDSAIITDVASVKGFIDGLKGRIVGGHPMAGTENSGIRAAKAHLFENANYIIVSKSGGEKDADEVEGVIRLLKAKPVRMTAKEHDRAVADISHLPHAAAYSLINAVDYGENIAGTGLMDTTRIASSDPDFWLNVMKLNSDNLLDSIDRFQLKLGELKSYIMARDDVKLKEFLTAGKAKRDRLKTQRKYLTEYVIDVDILDEVGAIGKIADRLAADNISIANISIMDSREGASGALRLELKDEISYIKAKKLFVDKD